MKVYVETLYHYGCNCKGYYTIADKPPTIGDVCTCPVCKKDSLLTTIEYPSGHVQMKGIAKKADVDDTSNL